MTRVWCCAAERLNDAEADAAAQELARTARRRRIPLQAREWVLQAIVSCRRPVELPPMPTPQQHTQQQQPRLPQAQQQKPASKRRCTSAAAPAAALAVARSPRRASAAAAAAAPAAGDCDAASNDEGMMLTPEFPRSQQQQQQQSPRGGMRPPDAVAPADITLQNPTDGPPPGLGLPATQFRTYYSSFLRVSV